MKSFNPKGKFTTRGEVLAFSGSSIISFMDQNTQTLVEVGKMVQNEFSKQSFYNKMVLLPTNTFHITVLGLIQECYRDTWPSYIPKNASISEANRLLYERFIQVKSPSNIQLEVVGLVPQAILLNPVNKEDKYKLNYYRQSLQRQLELELDVEPFQYHMSVAYVVDELTTNERVLLDYYCDKLYLKMDPLPRFTLPKIQFTYYEDMLNYYPEGHEKCFGVPR